MRAMADTALFERIRRSVAGEVKAAYPLAPWTSVRAGGAAELWVRPKEGAALVELLRIAREEGMPITVLGGGANTLVGDGGVRGAVLKLPADLLPEEKELDSEGGRLTVCGGAAITRLITLMKSHALVGAEFLAGIPGTIGGAVTMNAGTKHGECMSVVEGVELATPDGIGWVEARELPHRYRHTQLPPGAVVTRARFRLRLGDPAASRKKMESDLAYRKATQPLSQPNFGSVFKNPRPHFAGALIDVVGLKGHTIGRAQISTVHANWIVNLGGAWARDVTSLMALAQARVRERFGVELEPEVKRVGVFIESEGEAS